MNKYSTLVSPLRRKNRNKVYKHVFTPDDFLKNILGHPVFDSKRYFSSNNYKHLLQELLSEYSQNTYGSFCKKINTE